MRIVGKILGWVLATMLIILSVCAFGGHQFSPIPLGLDFLVMAALVIENTVIEFKKPKTRYRQYTITYSDGVIERHIGKVDAVWGFSTKSGKSVTHIGITDFESEDPNL